MYLFQERLIFLPSALPQDYVFEFEQEFEEFTLTTTDGAALNALHFKTHNPKGVILYFHGNAGDLSRWGQVVNYFEPYGYDVIVMDYRTYGKSTGALSETALYKDAALMYDKAKSMYSEEQVVVYGRSLGTTFATSVAANFKPKHLVLEAPFCSLTKAAKERYWFLPVKWLLRYRFPTDTLLKEVTAPVTIIHGTEDRVVPYENSLCLQKILPKESLSLVTIKGGSHHDLSQYSNYEETIRTILSN
jgi:pimeloyl-ACP methyl ester carboxylesterase